MHSLDAEDPVAATSDFLLGLTHPYWNHHYTLVSQPNATEMALIGESRIAEILANVIFPFLTARGVDVWHGYHKLPARLSNRRLETGATRLFGDDTRRREFVKTSRINKACCRSTKTSACRITPTARTALSPEQMQKWT
jgi:hypothetical protein